MGKTRNTGKLATEIQFDNSNNLVIGNSTSSSFNTSGSVNANGGITGSIFGIGNPTSFSASISSNLVNLESKSASVDTTIGSINSKTGSYATTGSNSFYGTQVFSGSVYIANDLVVQGSSSIQYISASSVSIGTNIVQLNTANPSVRFAGLSIIDSGSIGGSGSFLYDSVQDEFIFVHRGNGTNVTSSHFVLGPETYDSLGNETYLTTNILSKGTGKEHLIDSCIFDNGTTTCIKNDLIGTGTSYFVGNVGIGIASPAEKIHVFGSSGATSPRILIQSHDTANATAGLTLYGRDASNVNKVSEIATAGCDLRISVNSAERMRITSTGRIGIGTTSPGALLAVHGCSGVDGFGFFMGGAGTTLGGIKVGNDVTTYGSLYFDNATNDVLLLQQYPIGNLRLGTNSGEKMRITNSGNVVIGNTTAYGGLTVSDFTANDGNDAISLFYRGTTGGHQSLMKFYDFRGQVNASLGNELEDDTAGTPRARMVFKTSNGGSPIERLRITTCGCITLCNNNLPLASISNFGYGGSYQILILGNTNNGQTKSMAFGVDVSGNASGAFAGYGNEYIWRCAGSFITPNSANNGYNTLLGWNTTGCISFPNAICTPTISITSNPIGVEYLVIAGGGGGGWDVGGGGGAGGVLNGSTGIWPGTYNIGIGGGGPGKSGGGGVSTSQNGYNTYAIGLMAIGGGGGGNYSAGHGSSGGSGGGGAGYGSTTYAGFGMKGQGFEGGCGINVGGNTSTGGGGGGAGGVGPSSVSNIGGSSTGGVGIISTIIGEHRSYGCGGRGGGDNWTGPMNTGTTNTGNGGDGAGNPNEGCAGGSGIVILKMKNTNTASFSGGLTTYTCTNVACYNIYVVTAGAGTVTIS